MGKVATKADFDRLSNQLATRLGESRGREVFLAVIDGLGDRIESSNISVRALRVRLQRIAHWCRQASFIVDDLYTFKSENGSRLKHEKGLLLVRARFRRFSGRSRLEEALSALGLLRSVEEELSSCDLAGMKRHVGRIFDGWESIGRAEYPRHPASPPTVPAMC